MAKLCQNKLQRNEYCKQLRHYGNLHGEYIDGAAARREGEAHLDLSLENPD